MNEIGRRGVLRGFVAAGLLGGVGTVPTAAAEPVTIRLGYGGAAEEQVWLLIAKPELGKNHGKSYKLDATRFQSSDKRAQAFEAGAIDLSQGSATGVIFAAAEGVTSKIIASITKESSRAFSTAFYVPDESPIKSVPDMKGKIVGINGFSTAGHLWLKAALEKHGLSDKDVTITPVPFPLRCRKPCGPARSMSVSFRNPSPRCWRIRPRSERYSTRNTACPSTRN